MLLSESHGAALLSVDRKVKECRSFGHNQISDVTAGVCHHSSEAKTPAVTSLIGVWPRGTTRLTL